MNRRVFAAAAPFAAMLWRSQKPAYGQSFETISGDTLRFNDGEIRLADILAPRVADIHGEPELFGLTARDILAAELAGSSYCFADAGPLDRWGRRVAHGFGAPGDPSLQERLVAAGAARVRPETDADDLIVRLLKAEAAAREARRGLWRFDYYAVHDALTAESAIGRFSLVEGVVAEAARGRGRIYLNFGEDYKTDFTITAPSRSARRWAAAGLDLETLGGVRVRGRGYCAWINGPSIELAHRHALEAPGQ